MTNNPDSWSQQPSEDSGWNGASNDQSSSTGWDEQSSQAWGPTQPGSTQDWEQQPSANQAWEQQPAQTWEQHSYQGQGASSGYGQPYSGYGQPYSAQPYGYPAMSPYGADPVPSKGPGMTALILALVALGVSLVLSVICGQAYATLFRELGTDLDADNIPPHLESALVRAGLALIAQVIPTIIGIVALVLAGRAMGKPGSKALGVWGLITALAAPVISFVVFIAIIIPALGT